jgi:putative transcriptional regulator
MTKRYKSELRAALHETVEGLHRIGLVDKKTMRHFDDRCLTSIERLSARQILALREREGVSQKVFARYLNVPVTLVSQWERGERKPSGPSLKLLSMVKHRGLDAIA